MKPSSPKHCVFEGPDLIQALLELCSTCDSRQICNIPGKDIKTEITTVNTSAAVFHGKIFVASKHYN